MASTLDEVISATIARRTAPQFRAIDDRFAGVNVRLATIEAKLGLVDVAPIIAPIPLARQTMARTVVVNRVAAKPASRKGTKPSKKDDKPTNRSLEATRIAEGAETFECPSCKGTGIWGKRQNGSDGECFDCFGQGAATRVRITQVENRKVRVAAAKEAAAQAS